VNSNNKKSLGQFHQQHAIIVGGSSGIGKAIACQLAREGAHLSIIARTEALLATTKAEIEADRMDRKQTVSAISADIADRGQAEQAIYQAIAHLGAPEILIISAGICHPGYFRELPMEVFENTMAVNYFGSLYILKAALPAMQQRSRGHVVLISSGAGLVGIYGYSPYSPSKFALRGLAESLRGELKPLGIYLSIVYPPDTDTPQLEAENRTKPLETKLITGSAKTRKAEEIAASVVKGIQKKSFVIAPGLEMSVLSWLHSLLSPLLNWYFDRLVVKAQNRSIPQNKTSGK
jgi:3-dehydrosphinganine reductase